MTGPLLSKPMPTLRRPQRPVNVFELLTVTTSEGAADRILAYFLDPNERHGLGSLGIDALLAILDGAPLIGADGRREESLDVASIMGVAGWSVQRQVRASSVDEDLDTLGRNGIIDLYLTHRELGLAVIIENKINAPLINPLASYARLAIGEGFESVVLAILAPYEHGLTPEQARWTSRSVTYSALLGAVENGLKDAHVSEDIQGAESVRRSLDILQQFIEVRKDVEVAQDYSAESQFLGEFREVRAEIDDVLDKVQQANELTKARSARLEPLLRERLEVVGLDRTAWEGHGTVSGRWPTCYNAYLFADSNVAVELLMSQDPRRQDPIFIKAYRGRKYQQLFADLDNVPLGTNWSATDEEIADAFVTRAQEIIATHSA